MSVTEKGIGTRSRDGSKIQRMYLVRGVSNENDARDETLASVGTTFDGFDRDDDAVSVEELTSTIYLATVVWIKPPGTCSFQFDVSTGSQHITQSKETVDSYGAAPPDHKGAIGVVKENGKQKVEGTDIEIPTFSFVTAL